jgi:hypothetical protein
VLGIPQAHHPFCQQFQRPALPSIRSLTTRQMNQLSLSLAIQAATFGAFAREASHESHLEALLHKPLLDAYHGAATERKGLGNLPIGMARVALTLITHQQDPRHKVVFGWSSAGMHHLLQKVSLLFAQSHGIVIMIGSHVLCSFFWGFFTTDSNARPALWARAGRDENRCQSYRQPG